MLSKLLVVMVILIIFITPVSKGDVTKDRLRMAVGIFLSPGGPTIIIKKGLICLLTVSMQLAIIKA